MKKIVNVGECPFCHNQIPCTHSVADNWDDMDQLPQEARHDPSLFELSVHRTDFEGQAGPVCPGHKYAPTRLTG